MGFQLNSRAAATASLLLSAFIAPAVSAQAIIRGFLYDDATGGPVIGTIMLVDPSTDAPVVHIITDSSGAFTLKTGAGVYQLAAVRSGYQSVLSAPIPLQNGERMTVRVPIAVSGDPQHHIGVIEHVKPDANAARAAAAMRDASMGGFESRRATGTGLHYSRRDFERSNVQTLGEFLQSVPGLRVRDPSSTSSMSTMRNAMSPVDMGLRGASANACHLGWFVDGHRMDLPGRTDPVTDGLGSIQLDAVDALEVFRGLSEMPPEFAEPDLRCGAIAIWTKRG
jgi:hypothetical protein